MQLRGGGAAGGPGGCRWVLRDCRLGLAFSLSSLPRQLHFSLAISLHLSKMGSTQATCLLFRTVPRYTYRVHHFQLGLFLLCDWSQSFRAKIYHPISTFILKKKKEFWDTDSRKGEHEWGRQSMTTGFQYKSLRPRSLALQALGCVYVCVCVFVCVCWGLAGNKARAACEPPLACTGPPGFRLCVGLAGN